MDVQLVRYRKKNNLEMNANADSGERHVINSATELSTVYNRV